MDTNEKFDTLARSYIAPIYFFDQKQGLDNNKTNGTVTLFKKNHELYGITNYHVYEHYKNKLKINPNYVCQIGHSLLINFKETERIFHEDADNDLIVFFLYAEELEKIGTKDNPKNGFRIIDNRLSEYLATQDDNNPETWLTHCAGYPGQDKITTQLSDREYEESFGFHCFHSRATCEKDKIILDFSSLKESEKIPQIGIFTKENMVFGGMSGGPIFGRTQSNPNDLSLFGIIYEGSAAGSTYEFIYGKPISILEKIL